MNQKVRNKKKNRIDSLLLCLLEAAILIPIPILVMWVFTERWAWPDLLPQVFSTRALMEVLGRKEQLTRVFSSSIVISSIVGILSVTIGVMTSKALVFYEFRGKKLMHFFSVLPFMVPATVFAMGVQMTFIRIGWNNTVTGVIIAHLICSLPYAVRLIMDGMEAVGCGLEEQARVLGASPVKAFCKVTLPILTPVLVSALSMSYIVSFSQYFLTLLIGGGQVKTFTLVMVPYLQGGDRNIACIYSMIFLVVTLLVFGIFDWIARRKSRESSAEFYM